MQYVFKRYFVLFLPLFFSFSFTAFISPDSSISENSRPDVLVVSVPIHSFTDMMNTNEVNLYIIEPDNTVWTYTAKTEVNPTGLSTNISEQDLRDKKVVYKFSDLAKFKESAKEIREKYASLEFKKLSNNSQDMVSELIAIYKNNEESKTTKKLNPKYKAMDLSSDQLDRILNLNKRY